MIKQKGKTSHNCEDNAMQVLCPLPGQIKGPIQSYRSPTLHLQRGVKC